MPRSGWSGRKVTNAITWVVTRDQGICGICDHPGANSLDHIQPVATHPDLEWEPTNWQAVHLDNAGRPKGCTTDGCHCVGNISRGVIPLEMIRRVVHEANTQARPRSRTW